jgi:hypothetical protein
MALLGVFGIESPAPIDGVMQKGNPTIKLFDDSGREIYRAGPPFNRLVGQK